MITPGVLRQIADLLDAVPREGSLPDVPEGAAVIRMSDTLARQITVVLREAAEALLERRRTG